MAKQKPKSQREFLKKSDFLLKSYKHNYPMHSQFMGEMLSEYLGEVSLLEMKEQNEKLEQMTAMQLDVETWTDGQQIINEYAYNKVEDSLEDLSDADYTALVESGKYASQMNKALLEGWKTMARVMYDVFIEPEKSKAFVIDPSKTNAAISKRNFDCVQ
jgi:ferredoxin-NADP reductase